MVYAFEPFLLLFETELLHIKTWTQFFLQHWKILKIVNFATLFEQNLWSTLFGKIDHSISPMCVDNRFTEAEFPSKINLSLLCQLTISFILFCFIITE